jgi:hypothetical protein
MKSLLTFLIVFFIVSVAWSQKTAEQYFVVIPDLPASPCESGIEGHTDFMLKTNKLLDEIKQDLNERHKKARQFMKRNEDAARRNALANSGMVLTPGQMQVMQQENKHLTKEQKKKLADEVMQQNMNISMQEIENLKKDKKHVDPASAENWTKSYSTELEAQREGNPEKFQADQIKNKEMFDIQKELDHEQKVLNGGLYEFTERLNKLQEEADTAHARLRLITGPKYAYVDTITSQLAREKKKCGCTMEDRSKQVYEEVNLILEQIYLQEYQYCLPLTPQYLEIMKDYKQYIFTQFERCNRIENLQEEVQFRQTGVRDPEFKPGALAVESVKDYVVLLTGVFKYKIRGNPLSDRTEPE